METLLTDASRTEALGAALAQACTGGCQIHLRGHLGAGKTTLVRGFLKALGHEGPVPSPTYTLIEPYELAGRTVYHLDLYRLADPEELEFLGLRDLLDEGAALLVEWPEQGAGLLPAPDLVVHLEYVAEGRRARLEAGGAGGRKLLGAVGRAWSQLQQEA